MMRPDKDTYFLCIAASVALRSSCHSRAVGCVLVNNQFNILSTGYNGPASGTPHCNPCSRKDIPSGQGLDSCVGIHAEQNALLQCPDTALIYTAYVTTSPCITCVKLLLNTGCKRIVYLDEYPQDVPKRLWESTGREWIHFTADKNIMEAINGIISIRKHFKTCNDRS